MADSGIHVVDDGGDQLPVLFLHAFPMHGGMWHAQRDFLRGKARFISFDARGLGKSRSRGPTMLEHLVDDALSVLDQLRVPAALLCGLSMGGYIALRLTERAPERVRGLLLCDTQAGADTDETKLKRAEGVRKLMREGVEAYAEGFMKGALSSRTLETRSDVVADVKRLILESTAEGIAGGLLALATRTDTSSSLTRIRVPTRVLVGDHDTLTPPAVAHALATAIPGANVHELHGAGHLSNLECPDAFNAFVLQHIERVARAGH
jgi:3-oxoadipate enol-lactonase